MHQCTQPICKGQCISEDTKSIRLGLRVITLISWPTVEGGGGVSVLGVTVKLLMCRKKGGVHSTLYSPLRKSATPRMRGRKTTLLILLLNTLCHISLRHPLRPQSLWTWWSGRVGGGLDILIFRMSKPNKSTPINTILGCVVAKLDKGFWLKWLGGVAISRSCEVLKVPSGQIGSAWEWYHWKAL